MILAMMLAAGVQTSGLDAPVTQQPTVRSEIKNGFETARACDDLNISPDAVDSCIGRIVTDYRVAHPAPGPFIAGVNLRKWMIGYRFVVVAAQLPKNRFAQDAGRSGAISAGRAELDVRELIAGLGISIDDAFEAAAVIPENRPKSVFPMR